MPRVRFTIRRLFYFFLAAYLILGAGVMLALWQEHKAQTTSCHSRQEAREGVRNLVLLVTTPQDFNGDGVIDFTPKLDNPLVKALADSLHHGGSLAVINC